MNKSEYSKFIEKAQDGSLVDVLNPAFILSGAHSFLLADVVAGKYDLKELAKRELENRGLDASGVWVGFDKTII